MLRKFIFVASSVCLLACDEGEPGRGPNGGVFSPDSKNPGTDVPASTNPNSGPSVDAGTPDDPAPEKPRPYLPKDINHILFAGQSNAVALNATPTTFTQPYSNVSFNTGVMPMTGCSGEGCSTFQKPSSFVPLIEGDYFFGGSFVETACSSFANEVSRMSAGHTSLVSNHGRSGNTYSCLRKGGCNYKVGLLSPFTQGMMEVQAGKEISATLNKSYVVRAVLSIHGESDHYSYASNIEEFPLPGTDGTPNKIKDYTDGLLEWQSDYENGVKEITNQTDEVPLFVTQVSGWSGTKVSVVAQMQLDAHIRSNGKVMLVAPGYSLPFQNDCRHLTTEGQIRFGKYFARAYKRVVIDGLTWNPVRPQKITRQGNQLMIKYYVPTPPLVLDTDLIPDPGNLGYEYTDNTVTSPQITNVSVTAPDTVTITFNSVLKAGGTLSYAQNQPVSGCTGVYGARGNVRDSDEAPVYNWGVLFITSVP